MDWYLTVLKQYTVFSGRARRKEYWMFFLINLIVSLAINVIEAIVLGTAFLGLIYALAVFLPYLAVTIRRLHDTDRSGWWFLIAFIPLVGAIVLLVFLVMEGTSGDNQFGADPKA